METQKLQLKAFAHKSEDGRITVIASDETVDRSGEVVSIDAWDLANFQQSPRLLIDHDYSVGFLRREEGGRILNELLEVSFVAVPCNPNARTLSVKDIGPDEEKAVEAFVSKTQEPVSVEEPQKPEEQEESKTIEPEAKAGRVISEKNRQTLQSAIEYMTQASGALQQLLDAAEAQGSEGKVHDGDGSSKQRSSDAGSDEEVFKQWLLMKQVLRAVNTATSDALSKSKLFIRSK